MSQALSIILPVRNAESTLGQWVSEGLQAAADLTSHFELLILDEGSSDDTFDCASELCRRFPQVRAIRTPGRPQAYLICPVGLGHARGDLILYRPSDCRQPLDLVGSLWPRLATHDLIVSTFMSEESGIRGFVQRLLNGSRGERFGLRLARRSTAFALHRMRQPADEAALPEWLDKLGCRWHAMDHSRLEKQFTKFTPHGVQRPKFLRAEARGTKRPGAR